MAKKRLSKSSLLWFIRSRSFVTVPDIRRRFNITGDDEMSAVDGQSGRVYIGLPDETAHLIQELWREGKIGFEFNIDVKAKAVTGVYAVSNARYKPTRHPTATPSAPAPKSSRDEEKVS